MSEQSCKVIHRRNACLPRAAATLLALWVAASPVLALSPQELARSFAYCAGRLSAQAQAETTPDSAQLIRLSQDMDDLLAATIAPEDRVYFERLTRAGRVAQIELISLAQYSFDADEAAQADRLARHQIAQCRAMVLGG